MVLCFGARIGREGVGAGVDWLTWEGVMDSKRMSPDLTLSVLLHVSYVKPNDNPVM
jgi:hypothetical protein